jgi:hypothetical protein
MGRAQELSAKAADERRRARLWLLQFIGEGKPRYATKSELRDAAIRELAVSKPSFDFAWVDTIERTGQRHWYEPLRRRLRRCD